MSAGRALRHRVASGVAPLLSTLVLVALAAACGSSDPNPAQGMNGTWRVTPGSMDETAAGRGSCTVAPFTMTIDSTAASIQATLPTGLNLQCTDSAFALDPVPAISWVYFTLTDSQHFAAFTVAGSVNGELVGFAWPDNAGDSIGGVQVNLNQSQIVPVGQGTWKARRQ